MAKKTTKLSAPQNTEVLEPVKPVPEHLKKEVTADLPDDVESCIDLAASCYYNAQVQKTLYGWFIGRIAEHIDAKHGEKNKADKELCETIGTEMRYLKYMKAIYRTFPEYEQVEKLIRDHSLGTSALREIARLEEPDVKKVVKMLDDGSINPSLSAIRETVDDTLGVTSGKEAPEEKKAESGIEQQKKNAPDTLKDNEPGDPEGSGAQFLNQYRDILVHFRKEKLVDLEDVQKVVETISDRVGSDKAEVEKAVAGLLNEVDDLIRDLDELGEMLHKTSSEEEEE